MLKIAVTELEYYKAATVFENSEFAECIPCPAEEGRLADFIQKKGIRYVVVGTEKYTDKLYDAIEEGGVIARFGVGHDGIDKKRAAQKNIYCTNTPGVLDQSVAELAIGLIMSAARSIPMCSSETRNGNWRNKLGGEICGSTLAVIGCGRIGSKVAEIAKNGLGMNVCGCDVREPSDLSLFDRFTHDFTLSVKEADFVSLHIPALSETKNFIDLGKLEMLKQTAVLVNTSRGDVVDESALYDVLKANRIAGAALDVFKSEPYKPFDTNKDLRTLGNVIMTPHLGSSTTQACERMAKVALKNILLCHNKNIDEMDRIN